MVTAISRIRVATVLILCALVVSACSDKDLKRVSDALVDTGLAVNAMQTTAIAANQNNLISVDETRAVLIFTQKVNAAAKQASDLTRKINRLAPEDRKNIGQILDPILREIIAARGQIQPIKHEATRVTLLAGLTSIETAVNAVKLSVEK